MGFFKSTITVKWCFVVSILIFPAVGQSAFDHEHPSPTRTTVLPDQEFHCHTGYSLPQCQEDILQLKRVLAHYPIQALGHWTWVLVRSQDWKLISRRLQLNPDSPAFSALKPRETFLDEALFIHDPERTIELMAEWRRSMPELLELAVSHELGHALCNDADELAAQRFGEELRNGSTPRCAVSKRRNTRTESVVAGETHRSKPNAFDSLSSKVPRICAPACD